MRTVSGKIAVTVSGTLLTLAGVPTAFAQTQTDTTGAQILRQVEPPAIREQSVQPRKEITVAEPEAVQGAKVAIRSFVFTGNSLFKADELARPLERFVGQKLALAELNYAADLIGKYYQDRGFFARAVVPPQDVVDGRVRIEIVESRLDKVEVDPSAAGKNDNRLRAYVGAGLKSGDPLDLRRIERGTLLLNQLPGGSYRTVLRAGSVEGSSSVVLVSEAGTNQRFSAMVDSSGSARSGRERMIFSASVPSVVAFGDELAMTALASRGVQYGRAAYSLPVGTSGLAASLAVSGLRYKLLNTPVALKGHTEAAIVAVRYPLILQADRAVLISFEGGYRQFSDRAATVVTDRSLVFGSASIDFNSADRFLFGGSSAIGINVLAGRTDTLGNHVRISGYVQRRQNLTERDSLILRVTGQYGTRKLDQSNLLMINGTSGVAAFSNDDDVSGRSGLVGRATFDHEFTPAFRASVFYDLGKVYGVSPNRPTSLQGVGIGANWQALPGLVLDASVARPIKNPNEFNSKVKAWISARVAF